MVHVFLKVSHPRSSFNTHIAEMKKDKPATTRFSNCGRHFENLYSLCHHHDSEEFNDTSYIKNRFAV